MDQFKNKRESHKHSLKILDILKLYDSVLDSVTVVADMGCGAGLDIKWFAEAETRDDPPEPYNFICYAVDKDISTLQKNMPENVFPIEGDFTQRQLPRAADIMWCHDSFQYSTNPLQTLKVWNESMSINGMLILTVPQLSGHQYNRSVTRTYNGMYFNYTVCNLIYMLAVNGFDCKDAYFLKEENDPWIQVVVYKSDIEPMDPATTTWYDLMDKGLLHDSIVKSVSKFGYLRQEDIILPWLDRDFHLIKD